MSQVYVTYGLGNKFHPELVITNLYCYIGKPARAWWGSPIDADYSWKDWCIDNDWIPSDAKSQEEYFSDDNKILWTLKENTKVLMINSVDDIKTFIKKKYIVPTDEVSFSGYTWDFYNVLLDGYSAIQLNDPCIGHRFATPGEDLLNGWDCESIVVLDANKIVELDKES